MMSFINRLPSLTAIVFVRDEDALCFHSLFSVVLHLLPLAIETRHKVLLDLDQASEFFFFSFRFPFPSLFRASSQRNVSSLVSKRLHHGGN